MFFREGDPHDGWAGVVRMMTQLVTDRTRTNRTNRNRKIEMMEILIKKKMEIIMLRKAKVDRGGLVCCALSSSSSCSCSSSSFIHSFFRSFATKVATICVGGHGGGREEEEEEEEEEGVWRSR